MPRSLLPVDATPLQPAGFAEVVRTFEAPVSRYLVRIVGDAELARDLAQATSLSAFRAWPDPDPAYPGAWPDRIATDHAPTCLHRRKGIRWVPLSRLARRDREAPTADPVSPDPLFASGAVAVAVDGIVGADAIDAILDAMDPRDWATLLLHAAGCSGAEIGQRLGSSPASARTRLSHTRARFREEYGRLAVLSAPSGRERPAGMSGAVTTGRAGAPVMGVTR